MVHRRRPVPSVDGVGIREVLVHRYGLTWGGDDDREVNGGRVDSDGTSGSWSGLPVIVDITQSRLISREGGTVRVRSRSAIDDSCSVTVQGVRGRVEGVLEVVGLTGLSGVKGGSFKTGWEARQEALAIEVAEKVGSYGGNIRGIETSRWEIDQGTLAIEIGEEVISYRSTDIARIKASLWQTRQGAIIVEHIEEIFFYRRNMGGIKTSCRQTREGSIIVEAGKERVSHSGNVTRIKTSFWKTCQRGISVEVIEEKISHLSTNVARIKASFWETRQGTILIEVRERIMPCRSEV